MWYGSRDLGVTPVEAVVSCDNDVQYLRINQDGFPSRDIPLNKKPITYFIPWYAVVAAGFVLSHDLAIACLHSG